MQRYSSVTTLTLVFSTLSWLRFTSVCLQLDSHPHPGILDYGPHAAGMLGWLTSTYSGKQDGLYSNPHSSRCDHGQVISPVSISYVQCKIRMITGPKSCGCSVNKMK